MQRLGNEDSFEMNERHATQISKKPSFDDQVIPTHQPKELRDKAKQGLPSEFPDERPTRDRPLKAKAVAANAGKAQKDLNFGSRK